MSRSKHKPDLLRGTRTAPEKLAKLRALPSDHPIKVKNRDRARAWRKAHPGYGGRQRVAKDAWLRENDPDEYRRRTRTRALRKYGLTEQAWEALFDKQGRACAICKSDDSFGRWHTDHDATVGFKAVRGILCVRCNIGLGQFLHNTQTLYLAVGYLQEWEDGRKD